MHSKRRSLTFDLFYSAMSFGVYRGSIVLLGILVARYFGAVEFATFSYFNLSAAGIATLMGLGMASAAVRYAAEAKFSRERMPMIGALIVSSIAMIALVSVSAVLLPFGKERSLDSEGGFGLLLLASASISLATLFSSLLTGLGQQRLNFTLTILGATALFSGFVIAAFYGSVLGIYVSYTLSYATLAAISIYFCWQRAGTRLFELMPKSLHIKECLAFYKWMSLITIVAGLLPWTTGNIVLYRTGSAQTFALFSICWQFFALNLVLPNRLAQIALPEQVAATRTGNALQQTDRFALVAIAISTVGCAVGTVFSGFLMQLFGPSFVQYSNLVFPFLLAATACSAANIYGNNLVVSGGERSWLVISVGCCLLFLVFVLIVPTIDLSFLAYALACNYAAMSIAARLKLGSMRKLEAVPTGLH